MAGNPVLSDAEVAAIVAAVESAEARTSGEIVVITTAKVSDYPQVPFAWASLAALLLPLLAAVTILPFDRLLDGGWGTGEPPSPRAAVAIYALLQVMVFAVVGLIVAIPAVRRRLTPRWIRRDRVRRAAMDQFLARGLHRTDGRNAVLIFAALGDRDVEIVADQAAEDAVDQAVWDSAAKAVASGARRGATGEGLVQAVGVVADALATPFPPIPGDRDELPNDVVRL